MSNTAVYVAVVVIVAAFLVFLAAALTVSTRRGRAGANARRRHTPASAALGALGVGAAAVGLYLGWSGVSAPAINGVQQCGSTFGGGSYQGSGSAVAAVCQSKLSDRTTEAIVALAVGVSLAVASRLTLRQDERGSVA